MTKQRLTIAIRVLLFAASIALSLRSSWMLYHDRRCFDTSITYYAVSLLCLWLAFCSGLPRVRSVSSLKALGHRWWAHRWEILWLSLIFGVALFFRLYRFGYFPPAEGLAFEEAQTGGNAFAMLRKGWRTLEFPLIAYLPALSFALWGESTTTLRLPFLILGCLTVVPFYFLLRELVGYKVALFGTLLLAVSRWHTVASRIADELFLPIFFEVLILYLLVKGEKTKRPRYFFWLGIVSAYMLYAYSAYRVIPFLVIFFLAGRALQAVISSLQRRGEFSDQLRRICGRSWQPALVFTVAFLTVAGPLLSLTFGQGDRFFIEAFPRHLAGKGGGIVLPIFTPQYLDRLKKAVLIFTHQGATYAGLNLPDEPMLDPVSGVLFVLGVVYCALTFFRPYRLWFLLWIAVVVIVGTFPPNLYIGRFSTLIPLMFIFISFMMGDLGRRVDRRRGGNEQRSFGAFLVLLAIAAFVLNFTTFFGRQISDPQVRRAYADRVLALCNYAVSLTPDTYVYVWDQHQLLDYVFVPSNYSWACHAVRGEAVDRMESVLPAKVQADQVGYIFVNPTQTVDELSRLIGEFHPQVLAPSAVIEGEQDTYRIVAYLVLR